MKEAPPIPSDLIIPDSHAFARMSGDCLQKFHKCIYCMEAESAGGKKSAAASRNRYKIIGHNNFPENFLEKILILRRFETV